MQFIALKQITVPTLIISFYLFFDIQGDVEGERLVGQDRPSRIAAVALAIGGVFNRGTEPDKPIYWNC